MSTWTASRWASLATHALGGLLGGMVGGIFVVGVTLLLKTMIDFVSAQATWFLIVVPFIGLALAVLVLQGYGRREAAQAHAWRSGVDDPPSHRAFIPLEATQSQASDGGTFPVTSKLTAPQMQDRLRHKSPRDIYTP